MTRNLSIRILVALTAPVVFAAAQQSGQFSLGGTVVNSRTGEPVKRALVKLVRFRQPDAPDPRQNFVPPVTVTTFSDAAGVYRFEALAADRYFVSAEKPGFRVIPPEEPTEDPGQVDLTASKEGVQLKLSPLGAIGGKVVDQDGLPLRGVTVLARTVRIDEGIKQTIADRTVTTDDRGIYRVWNLQPGKYYIHATGRSGGTNLYAGETTPQYVANEAFKPRYFGGAGNLESATPIVIEPGTDATADVSLTLEPAYKIRGSLTNFVPRRTVKFELFAGEEDVSASRVSVNGDTGRFEVQDVPAGSYTLQATQGQTTAQVAVSVNAKDLDGVVAQLMPGVDIKVVSNIAGAPKGVGAAEGAVALIPRNGFCSAQLHPANRLSGKSYAVHGRQVVGSPDPVLIGVLPGAYRALIECFGAYVTSAMYGSQDLLVNPILIVQPGATLSAIEIAGALGGGSLIGTLSYHSATKDRRAGVLLVPQFSASTGPQIDQADQPDETGSLLLFEFGNLAPGRYVAYALSNIEDVEYRNPAFLQSLAGGVSVEVDDHGEKKIAIEGVVR